MMPQYTLAAGEVKNIPVTGRWLNVLDVDGRVTVESTGNEFSPVTVKSGYKLDLQNIASAALHNREQSPVIINFETSNIRIDGSGGGDVAISNKPTIRRIEEPITVNANATVENGKMSIRAPQIFSPLAIVSVPANSAVKIVDARAVMARKVTMQVISDDTTKLHLGNSSSINASAGLLLIGSINAIASAVIENESALWVYNDSSSAAKVAAVEEYINISTGA